ncbi:hypothetical protein B0H14DRAFT_3465925 [Mycena olivaceomarginata]|nr:hypothetical protein B0H14DRAFT_3465925 [Mycena olivaceomarginata]
MPIASAVSPTLLLVLHVALREQLSRTKREHASALEAVAAAAQTAEADKWVRAAKVDDLKDEIERLRRQIHELQQESADNWDLDGRLRPWRMQITAYFLRPSA